MSDQLAQYKSRMESEKADQEAFRAAVAEDKKKGVSLKTPYTLGLKDQVIALTRRQFQRRLQDKFQIYTSYGIMTVSNSEFSQNFPRDMSVLGTRFLYWRLLLQPAPYISRCLYSR
jgi:hypothetical protein